MQVVVSDSVRVVLVELFEYCPAFEEVFRGFLGVVGLQVVLPFNKILVPVLFSDFFNNVVICFKVFYVDLGF